MKNSYRHRFNMISSLSISDFFSPLALIALKFPEASIFINIVEGEAIHIFLFIHNFHCPVFIVRRLDRFLTVR